MMYEEMEVGMDLAGCVGCPHAEECEALELFWGCGVWEDSMGEDLQGSSIFLLKRTYVRLFLGFSGSIC